jgi:methyltransferase (TIGR00027 family)
VKEGRASRTAEYVALFRAIESSLPANRRLFEDPFARQFLSPRLSVVARACRLPGVAELVSRYIDRRWAGVRSSAVARTRFIDDALASSVDRGIEQLVILGAGFDSRAYRLPALSGLDIFEVDHPDTLAKKQALLQRSSCEVPSNLHFVGVDFQSNDLSSAMTAAGYSERAPAFILWEGVTNYLSESAVDATLRWCARSAPGSRVVFTYVHRAVLDDPRAFAGTENLFATLEAANESWTFGLEPSELERFLRRRGLKLDRDVGSAEYRAQYMPNIGRLMRGYEFYRIAIAHVP